MITIIVSIIIIRIVIIIHTHQKIPAIDQQAFSQAAKHV